MIDSYDRNHDSLKDAARLPSVESIRKFLVLAEQLHFGRAAGALHIAQPVLSRRIRALEDELKVQLFVRDRRATELTPAGSCSPTPDGCWPVRTRCTAGSPARPAARARSRSGSCPASS